MSFHRALRHAIAAVVVLAFGSACGGSDDDGTDSAFVSGPIQESDFLVEQGQLACAALEVCCAEAGLTFNPSFCQLLVSSPGAQPGVTYDATAAGECLDELRDSEIVCDEGPETPACDRVYAGALPLGAACTDDVECAPSADGDVTCDLSDEVCSLTRRGALGDTCSSSCEELQSGGWVCSGAGQSSLPDYEEVQCYREDGLICSSAVCAPLAELGESCSSDTDCVATAYCDFVTATCAALAGFGESCASTLCVEGAFCTPASSCEPAKSEGETCTTDDECVGNRCDAGSCGPDDPLAGLGEACLGFVCGGGS
jgi:hypothetical protein